MRNKRSIKSLIIAELDGNCSLKEKEILHNWLSQSKSNTRYYATIKDLWESSLSNASEIAQTDKEWERFKSRIIANPGKPWNTSIKIYWTRIAAILAIGLLIANLLFLKFNTEESYFVTSIAPRGSVSHTILPDGTLIYLNADSRIKYNVNSSSKQREVYISGEAWFDVKKNPKRPFIVHTPYYKVEALGTRFNVKTYDEEETIVTTLEEGLIRILSSENLKLKDEVLLKPGEQLVYNKSRKTLESRKNVDTQVFTSWKENKLIFLDMEFEDLVQLLERKYGVDIEVKDKSILDDHYTGTIRNETILEILNIIQHTHPIQYRIEGQKIIIDKE